MLCFVSWFLVASTSAIDCLERLVSEMTRYVSSGTLKPKHSLTVVECKIFGIRRWRIQCSLAVVTSSRPIQPVSCLQTVDGLGGSGTLVDFDERDSNWLTLTPWSALLLFS